MYFSPEAYLSGVGRILGLEEVLHYRRLWEEEIYPNLDRGLSAAIYTQTSDIEEEINGIMTYDRKVDKLIVEEVKELNRKLYEAFNRSAGI